jgi:Dolichyl-phosphate-mannose-protein mannosyltransferase
MKAQCVGKKGAIAIWGLGLVLIAAAYLRFAGITSGVANGYSHHRSLQPDEFVSLRGLLPINLRAGKLKAPQAYFEGTFNYYLWALPIAAEEFLAHQAHHTATYSDEDARFALLSGRIMTVIFDLVTTWVVFLILREWSESHSVAVLGAFLYSIVPMQVIYAHFMRPHILCNLLCALVILLSLRALRTPAWWRYFIIGIVCGLGAATRYPVGIIVSIPILFVLFRPATMAESWVKHSWGRFRFLFTGPIWWLASGGLLGLFLGHPYVFIDPRGVYQMIARETFRYIPSDAGNVSHVLPVWNYISTLIPYSMFPLLWVLAYGGIFYLCLRRKWWPVVMPLLIFSLLYTYPMSKAYQAVFARQVLLLVPGLCVIMALAAGDLWKAVGRSQILRGGLTVMLILLAGPSVLFDVAYVRAMQGRDVRLVLHHDLAAAIGDNVSTINVLELGTYFYTAMPGVDPLSSKKITVALHDRASPADYYIIGYDRPLSPEQRAYDISNVQTKGYFKFCREYYSPPSILGRKLDLSHFPPDMIYPFPTILLFCSAAKM